MVQCCSADTSYNPGSNDCSGGTIDSNGAQVTYASMSDGTEVSEDCSNAGSYTGQLTLRCAAGSVTIESGQCVDDAGGEAAAAQRCSAVRWWHSIVLPLLACELLPVYSRVWSCCIRRAKLGCCKV